MKNQWMVTTVRHTLTKGALVLGLSGLFLGATERVARATDGKPSMYVGINSGATPYGNDGSLRSDSRLYLSIRHQDGTWSSEREISGGNGIDAFGGHAETVTNWDGIDPNPLYWRVRLEEHNAWWLLETDDNFNLKGILINVGDSQYGYNTCMMDNVGCATDPTIRLTGSETTTTQPVAGKDRWYFGPHDVDIVGFGDVNHDGWNDTVAVGRSGTQSAGQVFVAYGTANGFIYWSWRSQGRMLDDGASVRVGDVNGDGYADLVASGTSSTTAGWVVVGLSDGTGFSQWSWASQRRMLDDGGVIRLADVNGDGKADLVATGTSSTTAGWVVLGLSNGSGFNQWTWTSNRRMLDDGAVIQLADVNNDGTADLVATGTSSTTAGLVVVGLSNWKPNDTISQGFGNSDRNGFHYGWSWSSNTRILDNNSNIWLTDFNNDRRADLVVNGTAGTSAGHVFVGQSLGSGTAFTGFHQWSWESPFAFLAH
jgi:hypothetical protein